MDKDTKMLIGLGLGIVAGVALLGFAGKAEASTQLLDDEEDIKAGSADVGLVVGDDLVEMDATRYAELVFDTIKQGIEDGEITYNPAETEFKRTIARNVAAAYVVIQLPNMGIDTEAMTPEERASVVGITTQFAHQYFDMVDAEEALTRETFAERISDAAGQVMSDVYDAARRVFSWKPSQDSFTGGWE